MWPDPQSHLSQSQSNLVPFTEEELNEKNPHFLHSDYQLCINWKERPRAEAATWGVL